MHRRLAAWFVVGLLLAPWASALAEEIEIGGRVLAPGGTPLPEASVELVPLLGSLETARRAYEETADEPAARSVTDDEGRYRLIAPAAGLWRVRVSAEGFVTRETLLRPLLDSLELEDVELPDDTGLTVRVLDEGGDPVAGAIVRLDAERPRFSFGRAAWAPATRRGTTGDDGAVTLSRGEDERADLVVAADGFAVGERPGVRGTSATVRIAGHGAQRIEIVGADGKPVPGVVAFVGERPVGIAASDAEGLLRLALDGGQTAELAFLAPDGRRLGRRVEGRAMGTDGERPSVRVELADRLAVAGRVIDARTRKSVAGGVVWDDERPGEAVLTDATGGFVYMAPRGTRVDLTAGAPGYLRSTGYAHQLLGDGRPGPTMVLDPAAAIEGKVVDGDGDPVAGAEIELEERQSPGGFRIQIGRPRQKPRAVTSPRGTFRLGPVDPDRPWLLQAAAEGFAPAETTVDGLEAYRTRRGVRIEMTAGRAVVGRIVDEEGQPIREAEVKLRPAQQHGGMGMRIMTGGDLPVAETASDDDGRFALPGLAAGSYDLAAVRSGFARGKLAGVEVGESEEPIDLGEIALLRGEQLQGIVLDRDGLPVQGAEVYAGQGGGMTLMLGGFGELEERKPDAVTDPAGWFVVYDLSPDEKYNLSVERTGFVNGAAKGLEVPRVEPVEIVLDAASDVIGHVLDPEGEPIAGARVNLQRSHTIEMGGNVMQTVMMTSENSDLEGRFVFPDQDPGKISLSAVASGFQESKLDGLEVPKGEDLDDVVLRLPMGAVVEGRVVAPDGRAAIGATVRRVEDTPGMVRMSGGSPVDGNGYYRLEGLEPGVVSIEAVHGDYPRVVRDIELGQGIHGLDLAFAGGQEVTGVVLDSAGGPIPGAVVRLVSTGRFWGGPEARSDGDGAFRVQGVQDGSYGVWAYAEGFADATGDQQVEVAGEPVPNVEVRMSRGGTIRGRILGIAPERFGDVSVRSEGGHFGFEGGRVDREGTYRIENQLPGPHTVVANLESSGRQARGQVTLEEGVLETTLDLQFEEGLTLSGRAVQGEEPIAGAMIYAEHEEIEHEGWTETVHDGSFRIEGLAPGRYRIRLQKWQTGLTHSETVDLGASREIVLEVPTAVVAGIVVDSTDRQPISGVSVSLTSDDQESSRGRRPQRAATTDLEGKFRLDSVGDGSWTFSASKKGYSAVTRSVTVQHERGLEELDIALDPTEGLILEARLPTGGIPDELGIAVLDAAGNALVAGNFATGENGRVRLRSVPPGSWELLVSAAGAAVSTLRADAPGATVPVALQPACDLVVRVPELAESADLATVRIVDTGGRPFRSLGWSGSPRSEWRMTRGHSHFRSLPPGSWTVRVTTSDGRSWEGTRQTVTGAPAELTLE